MSDVVQQVAAPPRADRVPMYILGGVAAAFLFVSQYSIDQTGERIEANTRAIANLTEVIMGVVANNAAQTAQIAEHERDITTLYQRQYQGRTQ